MAASVATPVDAAAAAKPDRAVDAAGGSGDGEPHRDRSESGAAMVAQPPREEANDVPAVEDKQFPQADASAAADAAVETEGEEVQAAVTTTAPDAHDLTAQGLETVRTPSIASPATIQVADTSVVSQPPSSSHVEPGVSAEPAPLKKATPTAARAKSAKNVLGISRSKKKSRKKKASGASHPSVGLSVDALDKNKVWGNGRILEVNVEEQRLKITFPSFSKHWDIWTDMLSIAPHCRYSNYPRRNARSWDGRTNLFTGERIAAEDDANGDADADAAADGDGDTSANQERIRSSSHEHVAATPAKAAVVRKHKKGYVLVPVVDGEAVSTPQPEKARKNSATLKREAAAAAAAAAVAVAAASEERTPSAPPPKKARVAKEPRVSAAPPPQVKEPYADAELAQQRAQNESAMERSSAFLRHCAALWKQQLTAMSDTDRQTLLGEKLDGGAVRVQERTVV